MEIYKTTNNITKEYYIGLNTTSNPKYLGSGVEIKKQIKKYGKENFTKEILCVNTISARAFFNIDIAPQTVTKVLAIFAIWPTS